MKIRDESDDGEQLDEQNGGPKHLVASGGGRLEHSQGLKLNKLEDTRSTLAV